MKPLTKADQKNLSKIPDNKWFEGIDVWPAIKRRDYSLWRLVDAGYLECKFIGNFRKYKKVKIKVKIKVQKMDNNIPPDIIEPKPRLSKAKLAPKANGISSTAARNARSTRNAVQNKKAGMTAIIQVPIGLGKSGTPPLKEKSPTEKERDGNKLIAEYMGAKTIASTGHMFFPGDISFTKSEFVNSLQYNYSYDWLMPVVKKIYSELMEKKIFYADRRDYNNAMEYQSRFNSIDKILKQFDINALFNSAVDTIIFLNANK